jgi:hypothetical protein
LNGQQVTEEPHLHILTSAELSAVVVQVVIIVVQVILVLVWNTSSVIVAGEEDSQGIFWQEHQGTETNIGASKHHNFEARWRSSITCAPTTSWRGEAREPACSSWGAEGHEIGSSI